MRILDCETPESIFNSLHSILGMTKSDIEEKFQEFDVDQYYKSYPKSQIDSDDLLLSRLISSQQEISFDATCWFHLTRANQNIKFEQGILPLGLQIDNIWDFLFSLLNIDFPRSEWNLFRHSIETDNDHRLASDYRLKVNRQHLWGPYAILIKDIALNPKAYANHDYLHVPEIVDDICVCFNQCYGFDLFDLYFRSTQPCIVKFIDYTGKLEHLKSGINYLYRLKKKTELPAPETYSFDGAGRLVPPDHIMAIQLLKNR